MKENLKTFDLSELEMFFQKINENKYRAKQVFRWIYRGITSFDEMTDLPVNLREKLKEIAEIGSLSIIECQLSKEDETRKYLFELPDGNTIESVFMKYKFGNSICISSQAGCRMGCLFCASGKDGLARNLSEWEMVDQIICAQRDTCERIGNVVVMGTGEPFDNYDQLSRFIRLINAKEGLDIGARSITISTCGIIPMIERFSIDFPQVNLAVSLHGSNDAERTAIMPIGRSYPMDQLFSACKAYTKKTGRRITFEYALIQGKNDQPENADELAQKLKGMLCHVNLIPLNLVSGTSYQSPDKRSATAFKERLEKKGISVTIRRELGSDIDAACGQLRMRK